MDTRRVHVDDPYVRAKMQLLGAVADANGVRLVWYRSWAMHTAIGKRLRTAREHATAEAAAERGIDLLPVPRTREEAVDDAFAELFPQVRNTRSRASVDRGGWYAGRAAADRADVGSPQSTLR